MFNLLLGCTWPPTQREVAAAETLCRDLGLGPLLDRMPGGMSQQVGETGWQLSHGERSRVFLARALLQQAELVILDESFAALDPQTLEQCLECARRHSATIVVIAHPGGPADGAGNGAWVLDGASAGGLTGELLGET
jgi:ATP-binding cassette subfamily B protein